MILETTANSWLQEGSFEKIGEGFPILQTDLLIEVMGGFTLNDILKERDFVRLSNITKKSGIETESSDTAEEHKGNTLKKIPPVLKA